MNKAKKTKTYRGGAAELYEDFKKHGKEIWPMYPFREGKIKAVYLDGNMPRYGATLQPVTDKQIADMEMIMRCPLELSALRAFLVQECKETHIESLTWLDILRHFQRYHASIHADVGGQKKEQIPPDLMNTAVVRSKYHVSRHALKMRVKRGTLKSYRDSDSPKNRSHCYSEADIARLYPKK